MANDSKIGIGFVGAGWMGTTLMQRIIEHQNGEIIALHQRSEKNARETLLNLGLSQELYIKDYSEMLNNPKIDAVFLCSPNSSHGPQSIAALNADKHVFCEKPCSTSYSDYLKQLELAKSKSHLITYVNYLMNFDSMEKRICKIVRDKQFGKITQIQVNYRHPINISGNKSWKLRSKIMGDAIGMGIIHAISVMLNIMEANGAKPVSVYATKNEESTRGFEAAPIYNIMINFNNGAAGFCFGNVDLANGYDAYHNIHGTDGGLIFDSYLDRPNKIRFWSNKTTDGKWIYPLDPTRCPTETLWPKDTTTPDSGDVVKHQTGACVNHFLDCIIEEKASFLSFENSSSTAELGWAALKSADNGQVVRIES